MFFHKQKKLAYILPPKCGTYTARDFFQNARWHFLTPFHATLEELTAKYPNLANYTVYGFLRDPLLRFESVILHLKRMPGVHPIFEKVLRDNGVTDSLEAVSYETVISVFPKLAEALPAFCHQQAAWLDHPKVTVLDFRNMEAELRRITGNTEQPLVRYNTSTDFGRSVITPAVEEFVRQQYADDYRLFDTLNGA